MKLREVVTDNEDKAIDVVMTVENAWRIVYADKRANGRSLKTAYRRSGVESANAPYRIYFNR